jgi:hypothetical protein
MNEPRLPKTNPQVLFTELDDGTGVLLHLDTKFYFTLNTTGVVVWKSLGEGAASEAAIAERIAARFRVDHATAARDVSALLGEMLENELVLPSR